MGDLANRINACTADTLSWIRTNRRQLNADNVDKTGERYLRMALTTSGLNARPFYLHPPFAVAVSSMSSIDADENVNVNIYTIDRHSDAVKQVNIQYQI
jgi:hypothetical protein